LLNSAVRSENFMKRISFGVVAWAMSVWFCTSVLGQDETGDRRSYETTIKTILRLGLDLQRALKAQYQETIHGQPISIEEGAMPFVKLEELPDEPRPQPKVALSEGFIDLVNRVAHAKAIDKIEKGYFRKYVLSLAAESGAVELKPLPNDTDKRFWTDDMINEQYSNFNSIIGVMVGTKLAHHALGHYKKHAAQLAASEGKRVPINNLLTPKEWEEALKLGTRNALDAGCTIEGVLPFFECFDRMPKRPGWTAFFVPDTAKYRDIRRILEKVQADFFAGKN
jgi:hypothetical protein